MPAIPGRVYTHNGSALVTKGVPDLPLDGDPPPPPPPPPVPPTAPTLSLAATTSTSVTLRWTAAGTPAAYPVTGYTVSSATAGGPPPPPPTTFTSTIKALGGLVHYYPLNATTQATDQQGSVNGTNTGGVTFSSAAATAGATFNGSNYLTFPDAPGFSLGGQASRGWSVVVFQTVLNWAEGTRGDGGYVHWMGKGGGGTQEWVFRHYFDPDTSGQSRAKRTSAYHYNPEGGQGTGSYFQDNDAAGVERMIVATMNTTTTSNPPNGSTGVSNGFGSSVPGGVWIYKNGVYREADGFQSGGGGVNIVPTNNNAPMRIGTRDMASFFIGRIRRVAFFNRQLTATEVSNLYAARNLSD